MITITKIKVTGTKGEELILRYNPAIQEFMAGCKNKYIPFLDHVCFTIIGLDSKTIVKEEINKGNHKQRYYFSMTDRFFKTKMYGVEEKYTVDPIGKITKYC